MEKSNDDEPECEPHHPHLFEEVRHLKPDYFISGNPNEPDPDDGGWHKYTYYNELDILRGYFDGKRTDNQS